MLTRIVLTAVVAGILVLFLAHQYNRVTKKLARVDSDLAPRGGGVEDDVLNETHKLEMGWEMDPLKLGCYVGFVAIVGSWFILNIVGPFASTRSSFFIGLTDGSYIATAILFLYVFGWMPRGGAVLIDKESLRVPRYCRVVVYKRDSPRTSVWIQRKSKQMHRCVVSDGERSSQFFVNAESARILRIWAAGAPGERAA